MVAKNKTKKADENTDQAAASAPVVETKTVVKQNGIKRPDSGTVTGKLWDIADEISGKENRPATRKEVVDRYMAEQPNANQATANTQYARWVQFWGVTDALRSIREKQTAERRAAKEAEVKQSAEQRDAERKAKADAAAKAKEERKREADAKKAAAASEREAQRKAKEDEKAAKEAAKREAEAKAAA